MRKGKGPGSATRELPAPLYLDQRSLYAEDLASKLLGLEASGAGAASSRLKKLFSQTGGR